MRDNPNNPHAQHGFGTLTLLAIGVMLLLVTGVGQAMWRHGTQLGAYCRDAMLGIEFNAGLDVCEAIGQSVVSFQRYLEYQVSSSSFGDTMNLEEFSGHMARQFSSMAVGYQSPQLSGFIDNSMLQQPFNLSGASSLDKLKLSLTQGAKGQNLLQSGHTSQGLRFMQSSASMGDMGVLSQLQLGSAFSQKGGTLPNDPARAKHYYSQALQSIQSLTRQNTPQSKQLLGALPMPADKMQSQLQRLIQAP